MRRIIFVFTVILSMLAGSVYAQSEGSFGLHGGAVLPTGDFGDDEGENQDGYAQTGFGIDAEYISPIGSQGLAWATNATFMLNACDIGQVHNAEATAWINAPVLTGLRYQDEVSSRLNIYGLAQIGVNFIKPPTVTFSDGDEVSYNLATSFGFSFGGGIIFDSGMRIGGKYLNLGEPEIKGTWGGSEGFTFTEDQPVSMFLVIIGFPIG